ncbi:MAG: hypothetical protein PHE55_14035 [Methylococcaceae bacterium]|nr:hypothetical protein [Methylococcaceae bacterium]
MNDNGLQHRWILSALALLMAVTRFHHEGTALNLLPDASLAVFFIAGFALGRQSIFAFFLAEAVLIDYVAIRGFGISDYCISPAYFFLVPTYGVMWLAGRWLARWELNHPARCGIALLASSTLAFLISNFSFYAGSGKVAGVGLIEYGHGLAAQYPGYVGAVAFYSILAIAIRSMFTTHLRLRGADR